jgi:hypothetical protein
VTATPQRAAVLTAHDWSSRRRVASAFRLAVSARCAGEFPEPPQLFRASAGGEEEARDLAKKDGVLATEDARDAAEQNALQLNLTRADFTDASLPRGQRPFAQASSSWAVSALRACAAPRFRRLLRLTDHALARYPRASKKAPRLPSSCLSSICAFVQFSICL